MNLEHVTNGDTHNVLTGNAESGEPLDGNRLESAANGTHNRPNADPPARRGGAPRGNTNRQRHGLRGMELPKDCKHVQNDVRKVRRQLEAAVFESKREIGIRDAGLIQSACRHERRARLAEQWLRREWDTLTTKEKLEILREASNASDSRDKCVEKLSLPDSGDDATAWSALYTPAVTQGARHDTNGTQRDTEPVRSPEARTGDSGASQGIGGDDA